MFMLRKCIGGISYLINFRSRRLYTSEINTRYPLNRLDGLQSQDGRFGVELHLLPCQDSNPGSFDRSILITTTIAPPQNHEDKTDVP